MNKNHYSLIKNIRQMHTPAYRVQLTASLYTNWRRKHWRRKHAGAGRQQRRKNSWPRDNNRIKGHGCNCNVDEGLRIRFADACAGCGKLAMCSPLHARVFTQSLEFPKNIGMRCCTCLDVLGAMLKQRRQCCDGSDMVKTHTNLHAQSSA